MSALSFPSHRGQWRDSYSESPFRRKSERGLSRHQTLQGGSYDRAGELRGTKSPGPDGIQLQAQKGIKPPVMDWRHRVTVTAAGGYKASKAVPVFTISLHSPQIPTIKASQG